MSTVRSSPVRAGIRFLLMLLMNVSLVAAYATACGPLRRYRRPLQVLWCRWNCALAGLRVRVSGTQHRGGHTLFVANHVSYLDIPVIGWFVDATFVAKAEVARWPLFGVAAKLTRTVFVHRTGTEAKQQGELLRSRIARGDNLTLFAEGTSTDGAAVAPFKSTLFAIAERMPAETPLTVQPISITYARDGDGVPLIGEARDRYAWFGDAMLLPHLWRLLGLNGCDVELRFLEPFPAAECADRKQLARRAQAAVAASVALVNAALEAPNAGAADAPPSGTARQPAGPEPDGGALAGRDASSPVRSGG